MTIANINGVNLNYEIAGQGKAIVFIHSFGGNTQDWSNQMPVLSPKYKVVTLDLRGHGKSAAPSREEDYSIHLFVDDVLALLKTLDITKCCLVGHSLGGYVALQFALERQDMLAALVIVDSAHVQPVRDPDYAQRMQKFGEIARSEGIEAAQKYMAAHNPHRAERLQRHPRPRAISGQRMPLPSVDGFIYTQRAVVKWGHSASRLSEIKVPTLIFWGDEDLMFTEAIRSLKKGIANSELVTIKGVGHSPHREAPDVFNEALLKFLARINW